MANLKITWTKSTIGYPQDQRRTIKALGLNKLNQSIVHQDCGAIRGMILKVRHLVKIEEAV